MGPLARALCTLAANWPFCQVRLSAARFAGQVRWPARLALHERALGQVRRQVARRALHQPDLGEGIGANGSESQTLQRCESKPANTRCAEIG